MVALEDIKCGAIQKFKSGEESEKKKSENNITVISNYGLLLKS